MDTIASFEKNLEEEFKIKCENMEKAFKLANEKMVNFPWQKIYNINIPILTFKNSTDVILLEDEY